MCIRDSLKAGLAGLCSCGRLFSRLIEFPDLVILPVIVRPDAYLRPSPASRDRVPVHPQLLALLPHADGGEERTQHPFRLGMQEQVVPDDGHALRRFNLEVYDCLVAGRQQMCIRDRLFSDSVYKINSTFSSFNSFSSLDLGTGLKSICTFRILAE